MIAKIVHLQNKTFPYQFDRHYIFFTHIVGRIIILDFRARSSTYGPVKVWSCSRQADIGGASGIDNSAATYGGVSSQSGEGVADGIGGADGLAGGTAADDTATMACVSGRGGDPDGLKEDDCEADGGGTDDIGKSGSVNWVLRRRRCWRW